MRRLFIAAALLLAALIPTASASAAVHHPTGEFSNFGECPLNDSNLFACLWSQTNGGYIQMGAKTVPIKYPVVLQGGLEIGEIGESVFIPAEGGNTLTKVAEPVPGGLTGITAPSWWPQILKDLFNEAINNGFTGVTATMELAGPVKVNVSGLISGGPAVTLPVKVKLGNSFLGSSCYIGSNSSPIRLNLTSGTTSPPPPNKPITGFAGNGKEGHGGDLLTLTGQKLVDNAFAAPGANGCGGFLFSWAVDPFVNSIVGVPSAAGTNTAILENTQQIGGAEPVRASE